MLIQTFRDGNLAKLQHTHSRVANYKAAQCSSCLWSLLERFPQSQCTRDNRDIGSVQQQEASLCARLYDKRSTITIVIVVRVWCKSMMQKVKIETPSSSDKLVGGRCMLGDVRRNDLFSPQRTITLSVCMLRLDSVVKYCRAVYDQSCPARRRSAKPIENAKHPWSSQQARLQSFLLSPDSWPSSPPPTSSWSRHWSSSGMSMGPPASLGFDSADTLWICLFRHNTAYVWTFKGCRCFLLVTNVGLPSCLLLPNISYSTHVLTVCILYIFKAAYSGHRQSGFCIFCTLFIH